MNKYPPLKSLPIFITAAETESFAITAKAHFITLPAVSQNIKALEEDLNCMLFIRTNNGVKLSNNGKIFLNTILPALNQIKKAKLNLINPKQHHLTISLLNSFAIIFLIPKLTDFYQKYPNIDIRLSTNWSLPTSQQKDIDLIIGYGRREDWPEHKIELLCEDHLIAVCHPALYDSDNLELLIQKNKLLAIENIDFRQHDWSAWCRKQKIKTPNPENFLLFSNTLQAIQSCLSQTGILVTHKLLVKELIKSKQLKEIHKPIKNKGWCYYIIYLSQGFSSEQEIFCAWLKSKVM